MKKIVPLAETPRKLGPRHTGSVLLLTAAWFAGCGAATSPPVHQDDAVQATVEAARVRTEAAQRMAQEPPASSAAQPEAAQAAGMRAAAEGAETLRRAEKEAVEGPAREAAENQRAFLEAAAKDCAKDKPARELYFAEQAAYREHQDAVAAWTAANCRDVEDRSDIVIDHGRDSSHMHYARKLSCPGAPARIVAYGAETNPIESGKYDDTRATRCRRVENATQKDGGPPDEETRRWLRDDLRQRGGR